MPIRRFGAVSVTSNRLVRQAEIFITSFLKNALMARYCGRFDQISGLKTGGTR